MNHKFEQDETEEEDMLEEYDFSNAQPGRYRGFQGSLIRVLEDGTEQVIKLKLANDSSDVESGKQHVDMFLDIFIVEYFKAKAGDRGYQRLINEALTEYIRNHDLKEDLRQIFREELERSRDI